MAGNEKYAKTMIRGICSHYPDYAMIVVSSVEGLNKTCIDHFKLAFAFQVPLIIVLTKTDLVNEEQIDRVTDQIRDLIKGVGIDKILISVTFLPSSLI